MNNHQGINNYPTANTASATTASVAKDMLLSKDNYDNKGTNRVILIVIFVVVAVVLPQVEFTANLLLDKAPAVFDALSSFSNFFMSGGK